MCVIVVVCGPAPGPVLALIHDTNYEAYDYETDGVE
jgi:hypothetical protein